MADKIKNVLFVCTGNSCRSIMAEAYLKSVLERFDGELAEIEVKSAGTLGLGGMAPSPETIEVLRETGIDTKGYHSKAISQIVLDWADVILVMSPQHREAIVSIDPSKDETTFFLGKFSKDADKYIIPDPIGTSLANYRTCFEMIKRSVDGFVEWLGENNKRNNGEDQ